MSSNQGGLPATELSHVTWSKSSRSGPTGGNCVEVAFLPGGDVAVRNSRYPGGPALIFTPAEWDAFLGGVAVGGFAPASR